jgi:prepilin-type processing-associated H-X9-DG protein
MSNQKQMAIALLQYAADYDENIVPAALGNSTQYTWCGLLETYISGSGIGNVNNNAGKNVQDGLFICPNAQESDYYCIKYGSPAPCNSNGPNSYSTYGMNNVYWMYADQTFGSTTLVSQLDMPADTIFAGDSKWGVAAGVQSNARVFGSTFNTTAEPPTYGNGAGIWVFRHNRGANFTFFDGHAKWLGIEQFNKKSKCGAENNLQYYICRTHN